jgi:thiol reductant ABC exporter CydD subunit
VRVLFSAAGPVPGARRRLRLLVAVTVATAVASVAAAEALARAVLDPGPAALGVLAALVAARGLAGAARDGAAGSAAAAVATEVRERLLREQAGRAARPGDPDRAAGRDAALLGAGVDGLHDAVALALPRLVTGVVLPLLVLVRVAVADPRSALVVLAGLVLVPVFMALVGRNTGERTRERLGELGRLGGVFADVLRALPGLRVLGVAADQAGVVRHWSDAYRRATMRVLRTAFLSALVLELLASLSIAVVAVPIGLRLLDGTMPLVAGLVVLLLVPEAFAALRAAGASAHETAGGLAVLDRLVPAPSPRAVGAAPPDPAGAVVELVGIRAGWEPGRPVLDGFDLRLEPGTCTALLGPSGCGKSTVLAVLAGLLEPGAGEVRVDGVPVADPADDRWRARLGWAPQSPQLTGATVAEALRLADPDAPDDRLWAALAAADVDHVVAAAPGGLDAPVRFSTGERHRLGLARALLRPSGLLLCDEPTAHVDADSEARVLDRRPPGVTMLVATHREAVAARADRVVHLAPAWDAVVAR